MTHEPVAHLRPFFPSAENFAPATTPHSEFPVGEFGFPSEHRGDVLRRDWSLYPEAHGWFEKHSEGA